MLSFEELFEDWASLADVLTELGYGDVTEFDCKALFNRLPEPLRDEAHCHGLNDTVFRDSAFEYLKAKPYVCQAVLKPIADAEQEDSVDPRQSSFNEVKTMLIDSGYDIRDSASRRAKYHASNINLGELQTNLEKLSGTKEIASFNDFVEFVVSSIDRIKNWEVDIRKIESLDKFAFDVTMATKDDFGWYKYSFTVTIKCEIVSNWSDYDTVLKLIK